MKRTLIPGIIALFLVCRMFAQAPSQPQSPFNRVELLAWMIINQYDTKRAVLHRGVDFQPTKDYLDTLRTAGALDLLIAAVRKAPVHPVSADGNSLPPRPSVPSAPTNPDAVSRENQVFQHLVQASKLDHDRDWQGAEKEFRSALAIEPDNPLLHVDLATVLPINQGEPGWDAAIAEVREAVRLEPGLMLAHSNLAYALSWKQQDINDAISEYREVVRLDPDDAGAYQALGYLLEQQGDVDRAIVAYREAVLRNPDAHLFLDYKLAVLQPGLEEKKGDYDGAIAQARAAVRMSPDSARAHFLLGRMLRIKGDDEEAAKEIRIGTTLGAKDWPTLRRIRVGSVVEAYRLIYKSQPTYPAKAKEARIQGTVRLEAVIGEDGIVHELKLLSGPPDLAKAAMEAVWKWRYQPTLLNGEPVGVVTEIDVNFSLANN